MKVAVNIKLQNTFRVILMEEDDLNDQSVFIQQVLEKFGIDASEEIIIEFFNNKRAPLDYQCIPILISQYKSDSSFHIEVRIEGAQSIINHSENLENYLRDHHCESILAEEKRESRLSDDSIEYLLNCVREYIHFEYSTNPTPNNIVQVSQSVIELFPSLSSNSDEKIENLYDRKNRTGMLYEKVRYKVRKNRTKQANVLAAEAKLNIISENDREKIDELMKYFESCVLPRDKTDLLNKMKASSEIRKGSNETNREIFDKCFHLYRVDSDLVLEDFKIMFSEYDHEALIKKWPEIEKKPHELFQISLDRKINEYHRDEIMHGFFTFLKVFPVHKIGFERAVSRLIIFSEDPKVEPQTLVRKDSDYPHIIGIYTKASKQYKFYLVVSKSLMNVPNDYNFLQVMDLYCKIHFNFCVPFDQSLSQFMAVLQKHVYGMKCDVKLTASTKNKAKQIFG